MPKTIPSKVLKMNKHNQLKWVSNELKIVEKYAEELRRFSRSLILGKDFVQRVDERPDLEKDKTD